MNDVSFSEPEFPNRRQSSPRQSALTRWVLWLGLARDEAGAQKVLLGVCVIALVATAAIWYSPPEQTESQQPLPEDLIPRTS